MRQFPNPHSRGLLIILLTVLFLAVLALTSAQPGQAAVTTWTGYYYPNKYLTGNPVVRVEASIDHDWGDRPPDGLAWSGDNFSVRWVRTDTFRSGTYIFGVASDDGFRLYVDGVLIMDEWRGRQGEWTLIEYEMTAGQHRVVVDYFEDTGRAYIMAGYYQKTNPQGTPVGRPAGTPRPGPTPTPTLPFVIGTPGGIAPAVASAIDPGTGLIVAEDNVKNFIWQGFPGPVGRSGGNGGTHFYVKNRNTKPTFEARWSYAFEQAGFYDVYVFVPSGLRATEYALYRVFYGNQLSSPIRVDQSRNENKWMYLGSYYFIPGVEQYVILNNVTGEPSASREILLDAVVFVLSD